MTAPSEEEYGAAVGRDRAASAAYNEALAASMPLLEESIKAGREVIRLGALRRDLREMLIEDLTSIRWGRGGATVKRLAKHTFRSEAVVQGVLDVLVEAGHLRKVGNVYQVPGAGA